MQAKHADVCSGVLFWIACTCRTHMLSLPSRCQKSDSWQQSGSVKTAKKSWTVPQCGHVTLNCVQMASKQAKVEFSSHIFFNSLDFTRCHCHAGTDILRLCGHTLQIGQVRAYYQALDFLLHTNYTLEMWCANAKLANQVPTSHVKTLIIRMSRSYRCFEWQER